MTKDYLWAIAKRFLRTAIAGGIAHVTVALSSILSAGGPLTWASLNQLGMTLVVAFVTGFISAADKLLRYDENYKGGLQ